MKQVCPFNCPTCTLHTYLFLQGTSGEFNGGFEYPMSGITYTDSPNKAWMDWEHAMVLVDLGKLASG